MVEIRLARGVAAEILNHARGNPEEECCGLLVGRHGAIAQAFPAKNVAKQPATAYEIAPKELFRIMREIRAAGLELLGIYHSHPQGDNQPSLRDVERAYYPGAAYFILSPRADAPEPIRAYSIRDGRWTQLEIKIQN
ncbi:MAG: M67 family metallopeptidase [Candidatus Acidiferrales bacterium]